MRARRYYQKTGKKITINGSDTAGYEKSKVECFNCHKMGHFAREYRNPRNQESRPRNQDSSRRTVNVEDTSSKAMVAIDGAGFNWSYMADEEVPTNLALMAFSDSEVHNNKTCSNTCLKSFETLKTHLDNLRVEFNKSEFNLATYKRGLASAEEQLVFYKKNEVMDQISDNNRKGVGYNDAPPPLTGLFAPPTIDLSNSGLKEFQQPEFEGYGFKDNKSVCENSSNEIKKTTDALIIKDWVSDCDEDDSEVMVLKSDNVQHKPKQANQPKKMVQKPVLNNVKKRIGQREVKPVWNNAMRVNHQNFSNSRRNFVPTAVLTKSGIVSVSAARPINTASPKSFVNAAKTRPNAFQKSHSLSRRPFYQQTALKNRNLNDKVKTAKIKSVNTAKEKKVTSAVEKQGINAVKSSACWGVSMRPKKGNEYECLHCIVAGYLSLRSNNRKSKAALSYGQLICR
ncbi:ribonuclease H-like domain-containing protein [Tanacetum coccineum]